MRRISEVLRALPWREIAGDVIGAVALLVLGAELLFIGWVLG